MTGAVYYVKWREQKLKEEKDILEKKVEERTIEVKKEKTIVEQQKFLIEEKHKEIKDSINYAERIQRALLASSKLLSENLKEYFVIFKPKDVVSGDFYWATRLPDNHFILATADSTGHGVPGAIMSMLNISCLDKTVTKGFINPDEILNETRKLVIENLNHDEDSGKDGMDVSLISIDFQTKIMRSASAYNSVWVVRNEQMIELKADKMPIGKHENDTIPFQLQTFQLQSGDLVYTFTDGYQDQFGGPNEKKFKAKQLLDLILNISGESMEKQKDILDQTFENWKGELDQTDDVCLIAFKIS